MCPEAENYISSVPTALFLRLYKIPVIKILKRGKFFEKSRNGLKIAGTSGMR